VGSPGRIWRVSVSYLPSRVIRGLCVGPTDSQRDKLMTDQVDQEQLIFDQTD
jgi:hypothetical protein